MTEPDASPDEVDDPAARLRSLERRLRREKRVVERLNPIEEPERYESLFTRVIELEEARRALRESLGTGPDDPDDPDEPDGD